MLGGTFDPFHVGHLGLARAARDELGLERVLVVPASDPPHKPGRPLSPSAVRLAMVEAGIAGEPRLETSRIELDRAGPSYTVDTLAGLAAAELATGREPDLTVILSVESFAGLPGWHEPSQILDLARIAVAPRAGFDRPDADWIRSIVGARADRIDVIDGPRIEGAALEHGHARRLRIGDPSSGRRGRVDRGARSGRRRGRHRGAWAVS